MGKPAFVIPEQQRHVFEEYLRNLGSVAEHDNAFHALLELDASWLPSLMAACESEADPAKCSSLVEIIWRSRRPETIDFLADKLIDSRPAVWKEALNGLVAFNSRAAMLLIKDVMFRCRKEEDAQRAEWLAEALTQIDGSESER